MDTDVLVAGIVQPLVSVATVLEYEAVLTREDQLIAMHAAREYVEGFLDRFLAMATEVSPYYNHGGLIRDPNDDKFVTAAINGSAEAIITFNIRDYVPRDGRVTGRGILVCHPGDLLRRLSWRPLATSPSASLLH